MPGTKMVDKSQNGNGSSSSGASRGSSSDISRGSSTESRGMTGSSISNKKNEAGAKDDEAEHECCGHTCTDRSHHKESD